LGDVRHDPFESGGRLPASQHATMPGRRWQAESRAHGSPATRAMVLLGPAVGLKSRLPNTSHSRHQARPASCPQIRSPAGQASLPRRLRRRPGRPGPWAAARQASGRTKGERRAPGGERRGEGKAGAWWGLKSRLSNTSIFRHQPRPASCPTETIACRTSQHALTTSPRARTAWPTGGGQVCQRQGERRGDGKAGACR